MYDVVIIGSGPAGLTASIYTTRANLKTLVLAGTKWGGQLMLTTDVENYPGFPQGIQGPELMQKFRDQTQRFKAEIVDKQVVRVDFSQRPFRVWTEGKDKGNRGNGGEWYQGRSIIIATGADTRWLGVPGEKRLIGKGVSSCAPCDAFFFKDKKVIVVGGGDAAMEEALVLTKFASSVAVVHRRDKLRASKIMQNRAFNNEKISFIWNTEVKEVLGDERIEAVRLSSKLKVKNSKLQFKIQNKDLEISPEELGKGKLNRLPAKIVKQKGKEIIWQLPIEGMFVAIGHIPNTAVFKDSGIELDKKGYIKKMSNVKCPACRQARQMSNVRWSKKKNIRKDWKNLAAKYPTLTSIEGVFVAGDVHDYRYRQAITAAGFGCMAAMDVQRWLEEEV